MSGNRDNGDNESDASKGERDARRREALQGSSPFLVILLLVVLIAIMVLIYAIAV